MAGWVAAPATGHPRQAGRLRIRPGLTRRRDRGATMTTYNAAAWLVDRHVEAGDGGRTAFRRRRRGDGLRRAAARGLPRPARARARSTSGAASASRWSLDDELAFPAWFLGALRSGVVPVPLSTMLTRGRPGGDRRRRRRRRRRAVAGLRRLRRRARRRPTPSCATPSSIGDAGGRRHGARSTRGPAFTDADEAPVAATTADSPAFWLYSSGTTGMPKGVMHRHGSPQATAETYAREVLDIGPDDRCLSVAKLFFAFGLGNSLTFPLAVGAHRDPQPAPADAARGRRARRAPSSRRCSSPAPASSPACSTPTCRRRRSRRCGRRSPPARRCRPTCSAASPTASAIPSSTASARPRRCTSSCPTARARSARARAAQPVPGYEARLVDEAGALVDGADTPGYLQVRGPSIATGYWSRDAATRAAFQGEWLATGDVYTRSDDGYWTFLGRNSDMIKAGGIWVSPAEVEAVLIEHPDVLEAAVVGARDAAGLEMTVAFVVARQGRTIDADAHRRPLPRADGGVQAAPPGPRRRPSCRRRRPARSSASPCATACDVRRRSSCAIVDGVDARRRRPARATDAGARAAARGARLDRAVARRARPRCTTRTGRPHGHVLPRRLRPQRAGAAAAPGDVHAPRGRRRAAGAARRARHRAAGARRPQRRRVDRPPPRRGRAPRRRRSCCSRRTCSSRTSASRRSPRPATPTRRPTCATASARYHDDVDAAFRGWNDVWLSTRRSASGTSPTGCRRSPRRCSSIQGDDDPYGTTRQLDLIAAGVGGPCERLVLAGVGHAPHLERRDEVVAAIAAFVDRR